MPEFKVKTADVDFGSKTEVGDPAIHVRKPGE